jgi:tetratricopeptide (TPR) repeat protein
MKIKTLSSFLWLPLVASLVAATAVSAQSQSTAPKSAPPPAPSAPGANSDQKLASASPSAAVPDRGQSYYHSALAHIYEEEAVASGRPEYMRHAVEEYKTALSADPNSPELNDELADLYFRTGQVRDAESTARGLLKSSPNNIDAHLFAPAERSTKRRFFLIAHRQHTRSGHRRV